MKTKTPLHKDGRADDACKVVNTILGSPWCIIIYPQNDNTIMSTFQSDSENLAFVRAFHAKLIPRELINDETGIYPVLNDDEIPDA